MISPNKIYEYRDAVRKLYKEESSASHDLLYDILGHKDTYPDYINSINVSLDSNSIIVEFTDKAKKEDKDAIISCIIMDIKRFIIRNIGYPILNNRDFAEFLDKDLCIDYIITNLSVEFNL